MVMMSAENFREAARILKYELSLPEKNSLLQETPHVDSLSDEDERKIGMEVLRRNIEKHFSDALNDIDLKSLELNPKRKTARPALFLATVYEEVRDVRENNGHEDLLDDTATTQRIADAVARDILHYHHRKIDPNFAENEPSFGF